jgi:hypothetical protein
VGESALRSSVAFQRPAPGHHFRYDQIGGSAPASSMGHLSVLRFEHVEVVEAKDRGVDAPAPGCRPRSAYRELPRQPYLLRDEDALIDILICSITQGGRSTGADGSTA